MSEINDHKHPGNRGRADMLRRRAARRFGSETPLPRGVSEPDFAAAVRDTGPTGDPTDGAALANEIHRQMSEDNELNVRSDP